MAWRSQIVGNAVGAWSRWIFSITVACPLLAMIATSISQTAMITSVRCVLTHPGPDDRPGRRHRPAGDSAVGLSSVFITLCRCRSRWHLYRRLIAWITDHAAKRAAGRWIGRPTRSISRNICDDIGSRPRAGDARGIGDLFACRMIAIRPLLGFCIPAREPGRSWKCSSTTCATSCR